MKRTETNHDLEALLLTENPDTLFMIFHPFVCLDFLLSRVEVYCLLIQQTAYAYFIV
jgi:hypothetical protein